MRKVCRSYLKKHKYRELTKLLLNLSGLKVSWIKRDFITLNRFFWVLKVSVKSESSPSAILSLNFGLKILEVFLLKIVILPVNMFIMNQRKKFLRLKLILLFFHILKMRGIIFSHGSNLTLMKNWPREPKMYRFLLRRAFLTKQLAVSR